MHYQTEYQGKLVKSFRPLSPYMPKLAAAIASWMAPSRGGVGAGIECPAFVADLVTELPCEPEGPWPYELGKFGRTQRIWRLLEHPVQVDGVVLRLSAPGGQNGRLYQKSRKVFARFGELDPMPPGAGPQTPAAAYYVPVAGESYRPVSRETGRPVDPVTGRELPPAPAHHASPNQAIEQLRQVVADQNERLAALEVALLGNGTPGGVDDERLQKVLAWVDGPEPDSIRPGARSPLELRINRKLVETGKDCNNARALAQQAWDAVKRAGLDPHPETVDVQEGEDE